MLQQDLAKRASFFGPHGHSLMNSLASNGAAIGAANTPNHIVISVFIAQVSPDAGVIAAHQSYSQAGKLRVAIGVKHLQVMQIVVRIVTGLQIEDGDLALRGGHNLHWKLVTRLTGQESAAVRFPERIEAEIALLHVKLILTAAVVGPERVEMRSQRELATDSIDRAVQPFGERFAANWKLGRGLAVQNLPPEKLRGAGLVFPKIPIFLAYLQHAGQMEIPRVGIDRDPCLGPGWQAVRSDQQAAVSVVRHIPPGDQRPVLAVRQEAEQGAPANVGGKGFCPGLPD